MRGKTLGKEGTLGTPITTREKPKGRSHQSPTGKGKIGRVICVEASLFKITGKMTTFTVTGA